MNDYFLKLDEAANYLKISKSKLYKMRSRKQIPYYKFCSRIQFNIVDLQNYAKQFRVEPTLLKTPNYKLKLPSI